MPQPVLTTPRLTLVPLAPEHLDWEVELDSDPEVMRYLEPRARTRESVEAFHERRLEAGRRVAGLGFWVGLHEADFVGWWLLEPEVDRDDVPVPGSAELGYRLLRRYWRQGFASEAARELLRHGFETVGLQRVYAQTMAVNTGSRAVMTTVGMSFARAFHQDFAEPVPGAEHGEVEYRITRPQWMSQAAAGTPPA